MHKIIKIEDIYTRRVNQTQHTSSQTKTSSKTIIIMSTIVNKYILLIIMVHQATITPQIQEQTLAI